MHYSTQCIHYISHYIVRKHIYARAYYVVYSITEYFVLKFAVLDYMHRVCPCSVMMFTALKYIVYVFHYMVIASIHTLQQP